MKPHRLLPLLLLALPGCKKPAAATQVQAQPGPGSLPSDHPPVDLPPTSRKVRRMSVDQMLASVYTVASDDGSVTWNQDTASIKTTLGKPDFINITDEDLTPSTLFMKFMDDVAHDVCNKMVAKAPSSQVLMKYAGPQDTLQTNPAAVKQNLRYLYLRYFGRKVQDADDTTIQPLLDVFAQVSQRTAQPDAGSLSGSTPATEGWRAVCVAGFLSPDFLLY